MFSANVSHPFPRKMWGAAWIRCYHRRVQSQPLKWWHVRWRPAGRAMRRAAILVAKIAVVLFVLDAIVYGAFYLIAPWQHAQGLAKVEPRLCLVPVDIPTKAQAPLSNASIDRYGFKIQLPNREISKTHEFDSITTASFRNGGGLMVHNTSSEEVVGLLISAFKENKRAESLFGRELLRSDFKLMQAAMSATPEQVKWWHFRSLQNQRTEALLMLKFGALVACRQPFESSSAIYAISFGEFRGYQCGNPDAPPYDAHIDVFDDASRHFAMTISGIRGHGQVITQEELNAMVASIRPSPEN